VPQRHTYEATSEQSPPYLDLSWRPGQRALPAEAVVDVDVHERTAQVRAQLRFQLPPGADAAGAMQTGQIRLTVPGAVHGLRANGALVKPDRGIAWIATNKAIADRQDVLLQYDVDLPRRKGSESGLLLERALTVPLVWPDGVTRRTAKVRVWGRPGSRVRPGDSPVLDSLWQDRPLEAVAGRPGLPQLVLEARGAELPLSLLVDEPSHTGQAALIGDRALVRVEIDEEGEHLYRARYLVRKASSGNLHMELPVSVAEAIHSIKVNGAPAHWHPTAWNSAQIDLTEDGPESFLLDVEYRVNGSFFEGKTSWRTTLYPPLFRGEALIGRTRWQVVLPRMQIGVAAGRNLHLDFQWGWQGWLVAPRAGLTDAELETWLTGKEATEAIERDPSLVCEGGGTSAPLVYHGPRWLWLLGCSGVVLVVVLALTLVPMPPAVLALLIGALALLVAGMGLFWPAVLPALVFGCEPALAVLLLVFGAHLLMRERYRRQVTFMPGFTRSSSSSLSRSTSNRRPREPSTVDAPAPSGILSAGASVPRQT
jgi:hypothetical protein